MSIPSSGLVLTGFTSSMTLTSGVGQTSPISILSSGDFIFTATYSEMTSGTASCSITNQLASIIISSGSYPTSLDLYKSFSVTFRLIGSDNNDFLLTSGFTFTANPSASVTITNTGLAFTITGIVSGTVVFTAAATGVVQVQNSVNFIAPHLSLVFSTNVIFI